MLPVFSRLARVLGLSRQSTPALTPDQIRQGRRDIFRFWDGERDRGADPLSIYRAMLAHPEFVASKHYDLAIKGDLPAIDITVRAVRELFGVRAWTDSHAGLTEGECLTLLRNFFAYLNALKKNGSPPPTLPGSTEPTSLEPTPTITSAKSGSTSTETVPSCDEGLEF